MAGRAFGTATGTATATATDGSDLRRVAGTPRVRAICEAERTLRLTRAWPGGTVDG